jgi:hypothetical protein
MKFSVEVECTAIEARQFLGLPDVSRLNDSVVDEMTKRMESNMQMLSPDALMKSWMSVGGQAQDTFLKLMSGGMAGLGTTGKK